MKTVPVLNKPGNSLASNLKAKKNSKEKRKIQLPGGEASTSSANLERSPSKDSRNYIGYGTDQLASIVEQSTGEQLTEEVSMAFVEDINYNLRFLIHDAFTKAQLAGRRGITSDDLNDTFECLEIEKIYGAPNSPTWHIITEPSGQNIHYLEDPVVNLFDLAELSVAYVQPKDVIISRKFLPQQAVDNNLKTYFQLMCKAVVERDKQLRKIALNDIRTNCLIGPIIGWFYNFSYVLLSKDVTYDALTIHALELLKCLELNPVSALIVSENQLKLVTNLLFQRLLKANGNSALVKPISHILTFICRRVVLRKVVLNKMVKNYVKGKRCFAFPIMCLANDFGVDGVLVVIITNLKHILHIVRLSREPKFISEALRAYYILCSTETYIENICIQFYDIFDDGVIPYWKNECFPSEELPRQYNWVNVRKELYKSRHKFFPPPNYKQKKMSIEEAFSCNEDETTTVNESRPLIRQKQKMHRIHPTNYKSNINSEDYIVIGKRTLLAKVFNRKIRKSRCTYHTMMCHNL